MNIDNIKWCITFLVNLTGNVKSSSIVRKRVAAAVKELKVLQDIQRTANETLAKITNTFLLLLLPTFLLVSDQIILNAGTPAKIDSLEHYFTVASIKPDIKPRIISLKLVDPGGNEFRYYLHHSTAGVKIYYCDSIPNGVYDVYARTINGQDLTSWFLVIREYMLYDRTSIDDDYHGKP